MNKLPDAICIGQSLHRDADRVRYYEEWFTALNAVVDPDDDHLWFNTDKPTLEGVILKLNYYSFSHRPSWPCTIDVSRAEVTFYDGSEVTYKVEDKQFPESPVAMQISKQLWKEILDRCRQIEQFFD